MLALILVLNAGCTPIEPDQKEYQWNKIDLSNELLHGVWQMEGYGRLVDISSDTLIVYHRIKDFCTADRGLVPSFSLYSIGENTSNLSLLYQNYGLKSEALQTRIDLNRLDSLPEACTSQPGIEKATPGEVFDLLWTAFDEHYAFFDERGVDWALQKAIYKPSIDSLENLDLLFPILTEVLGTLGDGHVNLYRGTEYAYNAGVGTLRLRNRIVEHWREQGKPGEEADFVSSWHQRVYASVYEVLDPGSLNKGAAGALEWGTIDSNVAYVRINRFSGLAGRGVTRPAQLDTLRAALRQMSVEIADKRFAIVDVTLNGGGMDPAAITVASFFADQSRHVLTKKIRGGHATEVLLEPAKGFQFTKPVYLLTSEVTASAAEAFVLIMRSFPHVKHVGERTRGGLSGLLPKQLPQDFVVTISNEAVFDAEGNLYEGKGIPPDEQIILFPHDSLYTGLLNALDKLARR